jgi:hypothetical protein
MGKREEKTPAMPKRATGEATMRDGVHQARITIEGRKRHTFALPTCSNKAEAKQRAR